MMLKRIISKIRRFIEIRRLLMLLNDNLIKFCIFEKNYTHNYRMNFYPSFLSNLSLMIIVIATPCPGKKGPTVLWT